MKKSEESKKKIIIRVLLILIAVAVIFITYLYIDHKLKEAYVTGLIYGQAATIVQIVEHTQNCTVLELFAANKNVSIIDMDCIDTIE